MSNKLIWVDEIYPETGEPTGKQVRKAVPMEASELPIISTDPRDYPLTPRQFNRFAALHGYDDAIEAVLAAIKSTDRETYAMVKGDVMGAKTFRFDVVMSVVGNTSLAAVIPDGVDVSEVTMSERWMIAKDY